MAQEHGAERLYEQSMRLGQKMQEFRQAINSLEFLEEFDLEALINEDISSGSANVSSIEFRLYLRILLDTNVIYIVFL